MTVYLGNFQTIECSSDYGVFDWLGWSIYWNYVSGTGELYNPNGEFHTAGDSLEALAEEAARHEEEGS